MGDKKEAKKVPMPDFLEYPEFMPREQLLRAICLAACRDVDGHGIPDLKVFLAGPPGSGKSSLLKALAEASSAMAFYPKSASGDGGCISIAVNAGDHVTLRPRKWILDMVKGLEQNKKKFCIVLLDELTSSKGAELFSFIQDGIIGDMTIPQDIMSRIIFFGAGNYPEHSTEARPLAGPLANRLCHIQWPHSSVVDAIQKFKNIANGEPPYAEVKPFVLSRAVKNSPEHAWVSETLSNFLASPTAKPEWLSNSIGCQPLDIEHQSRPWPSDRSWEVASYAMAAGLICGLNPTDPAIKLLVTGCVGKAGDAWLGTLTKVSGMGLDEMLDNLSDTIKARTKGYTIGQSAMILPNVSKIEDLPKYCDMCDKAFDNGYGASFYRIVLGIKSFIDKSKYGETTHLSFQENEHRMTILEKTAKLMQKYAEYKKIESENS